jgi:hypothetical protein
VAVDVTGFFDLAHHGAPAAATGDQAAERELLLHLARLVGAATVEDCLDLLTQFPRDDRLVGTMVHRAVEVEVAGADPIAQNLCTVGEKRFRSDTRNP